MEFNWYNDHSTHHCKGECKMMLLKSECYPHGRFQILKLVGNYLDFKKSIGFWKHPTFMLGAYAKWSL